MIAELNGVFKDITEGLDMAKKTDNTAPAEKKPTQKEMVQAALASGTDTGSNVDLSNWIQKTYSVKLEPQIVANLKSQLKKAEGGKPSAIIRTRAPRAPRANDKPA